MQNVTRIAAAALVAVSLGAAAVALAAAAKPAAPAADKAALMKRGQYLVNTMGCNDCHTPGTLFGAPDFKRALGGSEVGWKGPWGISFARNLTPDPETGLGYWSADELTKFLRTGNKPDGKQALPPMPWPNTAQMSDADMTAMVTYLMNAPIVKHKVPDALPPGQDYNGPVIVMPAPGAWDAPGAPPAGK